MGNDKSVKIAYLKYLSKISINSLSYFLPSQCWLLEIFSKETTAVQKRQKYSDIMEYNFSHLLSRKCFGIYIQK